MEAISRFIAFKSKAKTPNFDGVPEKESTWKNPKDQEWVEMFRAGSSRGYLYSKRNLQEMVNGFYADTNSLPVYQDHLDAIQWEGKTEYPVSGWILALAVGPSTKNPSVSSLWGKVEYSPDMAEKIRNGLFRYCSVYFCFATNDRNVVSNCHLLSLAVVNQPGIRDLQPLSLAASRHLRLNSQGKREKVIYLWSQENEEFENMSDELMKETENQQEQANALDPEVDALDEAGAKDQLEAFLEASRALAGDDTLALADALAFLQSQSDPSMMQSDTPALERMLESLKSEISKAKEQIKILSDRNRKYEERELDAILDGYDFSSDEAKQGFKEAGMMNRAMFDKQIKTLKAKEKIALRDSAPEVKTEDMKSVPTLVSEYKDPAFANEVLSGYKKYRKIQ